MCRFPLYVGRCKKECIERHEKEMGIKTTYAEIKEKTLEQIYEDIKRFKNLVEVVRCKDCKHYAPVEGGKPLCELHSHAVAQDDFCSYGERKDNGVL
jgi:hypothetical protein